ncbi:MAG: deoxyribose-phosphate aldolase [Bacteroidales bacterium]|nr:deoxyribose-phosphate aldolase [Bacteroidales bacterium]
MEHKHEHNHDHDHCNCGHDHNHDHNHEAQMPDRYTAAIQASHVIEDDAAVADAVAKIMDEHLQENMTKEVYTFLFNTIDLTTLKSTDSQSSVADFTENVNRFETEHPDLPNVAAICVYPNFAAVVRSVLEVCDVRIACVSGAFPSSQSFEEIKIAETSLARENGADEIDIVLNLGYFLDGDYESLCDEIIEQKEACRGGHLKVILETGALKSARNIKIASVLSMYSGADFIKTSTGKEFPGASLEAAYVMAQCIKEYYELTGRKVGFKASGGVASTEDAVKYYTIVKEVLGEEWLTNDLFRLGASRLANNLLSDIIGEPVKAF